MEIHGFIEYIWQSMDIIDAVVQFLAIISPGLDRGLLLKRIQNIAWQ